MEEVKLDYPVKHNDAVITSLHLRRPKVRDMLAAETLKGNEAQKEITMFANLCETDPAVIEGLDLTDYQKLQETYKDFLSSRPETRGGSA